MDIAEIRNYLEEYHDSSYHWALSCCSQNPIQAECVLQTSYLKILTGKAIYKGRSSFKTWLFAVIRLTAIENRRWNLLQQLKLVSYVNDTRPLIQREDLEKKVYYTQINELFQKALSALPKRQQEVLYLVFYHELSIQEASQVMEISIGSARTHYERGKNRLRQWARDLGVFDESTMARKKTKEIFPGDGTTASTACARFYKDLAGCVISK